MDVPYTKKRQAQYRGPSTSDDYNSRIEENYQDLTVLSNKARISEVEIAEFNRRMFKDLDFIGQKLAELDQRVSTLEDSVTRYTFYSVDDIDTDNFVGNPDPTLDIPVSERLNVDEAFGLITLPKAENASISKLFFTNSDGEEIIPPGIAFRVEQDSGSADTGLAFIDTSDPEYALYRKPGLVWERNVVVDSTDEDGAALTLYVKVPNDLFTTSKSNVVTILPFPTYGCNIEEVAYTTRVDPLLTSADGYTNLNSSGHYSGNADAVGWIAPGGWSGGDAGDDFIVDSGPKKFYFDAKDVTAIRVKIRQTHYYREGSSFIYSYGMARFDLGFDKFEPTGRTMIKVSPGSNISAINSVTPEIWNVSEAKIDEVFSYRVLWHNGGDVYIDANDSPIPIGGKPDIWIEVTLNSTGDGTPALSGLLVDYS